MSTAPGALGHRANPPYDNDRNQEQSRSSHQRASGRSTTTIGQRPADNKKEGLRP